MPCKISLLGFGHQEEEIKDTKGEITSCNSKKTDTTLADRKGTKVRTIIYKTETKDVSFCTKTLFSGSKFVVKKSTALQLYYRHIGRRYKRYQRGNQNPHIEEEQTTQWSKEKVQKDKQRSTKHAHKAKD